MIDTFIDMSRDAFVSESLQFRGRNGVNLDRFPFEVLLRVSVFFVGLVGAHTHDLIGSHRYSAKCDR